MCRASSNAVYRLVVVGVGVLWSAAASVPFVSAAAISGTFRSGLISRVVIFLIVRFLSVGIIDRVVSAILIYLTIFVVVVAIVVSFLVIDVHVVAGFFFILPRVIVWIHILVVLIVSIVFVFTIFTG